MLQQFAIFLCKSTAIAALLYGYYLLVLKNRKMNSYNRFYLLSAAGMSILLPLMHFNLHTANDTQQSLPITILNAISLPDEHEVTGKTESHISLAMIAGMAYALVALVLLAVMLYKIAWIYKLKKNSAVVKRGKVDVAYTENTKAPFSFFNTVFWRDTIDMDQEEGQQILRHEMAHVEQYHSADKLFIQAVVIACWANPVYWLMQKELSQVHEFIADEAAVENNDTSALAVMLLQCHYGHAIPHLVNPFFYSSIKRRIIMLDQNNKTNYALARRLMILPVLAATVFLSSFTVTKSSTTVNKAAHKVLLVVDAGHGGNDAGAVAADVMEKTLTLRICQKMSQLAAEYNVDAIQTRPDDNYVVLNTRVEKANAAKAGIFLSIHVNKAAPDNPIKGDYEVIVSGSNPKIGECKLLASSVISSMRQTGINPEFVDKGIHVLKNSNAPAIAIECGVIDNPSEVDMLQNDAKLESFCRSILSGVVAYENSATKK